MKGAAERAEMLEMTSLSMHFSWSELEDLAKYVEERMFVGGMVVFHEGDTKAFMCIIYRGKVDIIKETADMKRKLITSLGPGKVFGEMSVIDGSPRSATAVAAHDTVLLVLTKDEYERIIEEKPRLGVKILHMVAVSMSQRLRQTTGTLVEYLGRESQN
jgi:CRP/FNR family cyclic AMP-dependent transcriptional regulator